MKNIAEFKIGEKIHFKKDEANPYEVKAKEKNIIIATVEDGDYKRYTIIDTEKGICGPHDRTFNPYDFTKQEDIEQCLKDMINGNYGIAISQRHGAKISDVIDLEKK